MKGATMSRDEVLALFDREDRETQTAGLSVRAQAALLGLSRNRFYYQPLPPSAQELAIKRRIDEIYTAHPFYGIRRICAQLRTEGVLINHKAVARHMREMGLAGIAPGPSTSRGGGRASDSKYPYLLRGVVAQYPNHVWGVDITYIRLSESWGSWLYLVAVLDWYSRYVVSVVSWELSPSLSQPFVMAAARCALQTATPLIWNSDQGSQFASPQYIGLLAAAGVQISMDGRGRYVDNIFTERLWRTIKYEEVYLHEYTCPREAQRGLSRYLDFYNHQNHQRLHQALGYRTPADIYHQNPAEKGDDSTLKLAG
jgi:putative transposase